MNKRIDLKSLACGVFIGATLVFSIAAATSEGEPVIWEMKVIEGSLPHGTLEERINGEVSTGWQFVSASHSADRFGFAVLRREKK